MHSLEVKSLEKSFGTKTVFKNLSFSHDNESGILGIAGPNGSGKSTLLKCLAGLLRPSGGIFRWMEQGSELSHEELRARLGYAAPYINLYEELSVMENLRFLERLRRLDSGEEHLSELLSRLDIGSVSGQPFGNLSTGQQQRVRLASALFHNPTIIILDEPGANLDEQGHEIIQRLLEDFRGRRMLVLLASNDPRELEWCDRVYSVEDEAFM